MLSAVFAAFLFSLGLSGWVYSKMDHRLGTANLKNVMIVTCMAFAVSFIVFITILKFFLHF